MKVPKDGKIYFMGICGTGMASVAGLCKQAGYRVSGSDVGVYPPMSTMLEELGIEIFSPYDPKNIDRVSPDMVVIANALSRGHIELEHVLAKQTPYTSFAQLMGDLFLAKRRSAIVAGTHGKTTTTALLSHILTELKEKPGFVIGGIAKNFNYSFDLGSGEVFVIEGDEYDTAFFDKGAKFLHYHPRYLILNNLEFDHADIYPTLRAIEIQFEKLIKLVENPKFVIANIDDPGMCHLLKQMGYLDRLTQVSTLGKTPKAEYVVIESGVKAASTGVEWRGTIEGPEFGTLEFSTHLAGRHNISNIAQVIACLGKIQSDGALTLPLTKEKLVAAIASFAGVQRRLELLGSHHGIEIYEDFAHHPTAVRNVIETCRLNFPGRRLLVAFEPRNATSRRNVFQEDFARSLTIADQVYIGRCPVDQRIPEDQRMNTAAMVKSIGSKGKAFPENDQLASAVAGDVTEGDVVIFMSSGSFSGVQYRLLDLVKERFK